MDNVILYEDTLKLGYLGGKGESLYKLSQNFNVPKFVVIPSYVFDDVINLNQLNDRIVKIIGSIDYNSFENVEMKSEEIKCIINNIDIPIDWKEKISSVLKMLNKKMVIRSSATVEDGNKCSWAGQFSSYIDIELKHIIKYVKKCWASLFNVRALYYMHENNFSFDQLSMAVIIQNMILPKISGITFTKNPINNREDQMIIEFFNGHGDDIVSGNITPNNYIIDKLNKKKIGEFILGDFELDDYNLSKLINVFLTIEKYYKAYMDIEWVLSDTNELFIVQARNITT